MILKNNEKTYKCTNMYTSGDNRTFALTEEPSQMSGLVELVSDDAMELMSLNAEDYTYQYIRGAEQSWTIEFTNTEYVEPAPMPDPDPTPSSGDYDEFIAGLMEGCQNG